MELSSVPDKNGHSEESVSKLWSFFILENQIDQIPVGGRVKEDIQSKDDCKTKWNSWGLHYSIILLELCLHLCVSFCVGLCSDIFL